MGRSRSLVSVMGEDHQNRLLPKQRARVRTDTILGAAGWVVHGYKGANLYARQGEAVRELVTGTGPADDYVLFVDHQHPGMIAAGIVEDLEAALEELKELAHALQSLGVEVDD